MTHVCVLPYVEEALEAARRYGKGERQLWCPACERWRWPEECTHDDRRRGR